MSLARRNVALLALCQALAMSSNTILITTAALIGFGLAEDKSLATLPLTLRQVATMALTIPAALFMRRLGRQQGFLIGSGLGVVGAGLGIASVQQQSFGLFCLAIALLGAFNGFVGYYRFAAADAATEAFRAQAISWVVAGGTIAAIAAPWLARVSQTWFDSTLYVGSLVAILGLQLLTVVCLVLIQTPPPLVQENQDTGRSLLTIMGQPVFLVAVIGSMIGYGVMTLVMTATPLAMQAVPHSFGATASVIQWHVLGMFAPSFLTGSLIRYFGVIPIILVGILLNLLALGTNLLGLSFEHFAIALLLLGIGWNFMFVGSTTLLTAAYTPAEQAKTQAAHDFLMFGFVTLTTFLSGHLFHRFSWLTVNQVGLPLMAIALMAILWGTRPRSPSKVGL
ncbi:MAG: MFS transporter [Cyanobacteria bacterium P01_A01_bin.123]